MRRLFAALAALLCLASGVQADVFNLGPGYTNLETVPVGDPGNVGELSGAGAGGYGPDRICGSVGYNYRIGTYEVTAKQYTDFLNNKAKIDSHGLYNSSMWSDNNTGCKIQRNGGGTVADPYAYSVADDWANRPVNYVSYWDACRFANWLHNGQGDGDTETGAYTLGGYNGLDGRTIRRNVGWKWAVTSEDEWYKAAYYKGGGPNAGYWDYPTSSDTVPGQDMVDASGNNANHYTAPYVFPIERVRDSGKYTTVVGEFQNSGSPYSTFDQGGNVWEWNEAVIYDGYAYRGLRGGSFSIDPTCGLRASDRNYYYYYTPPSLENDSFGFRVASIPEPSAIVILAGGLISLWGVRRRRSKPAHSYLA